LKSDPKDIAGSIVATAPRQSNSRAVSRVVLIAARPFAGRAEKL
jgi:hypothetical protein